MTKPLPIVDRIDWRANAVTWTTEPFAIAGTQRTMAAGAAVVQAGVVKLNSGTQSFTIPNATALFLNLSYVYHARAEISLKALLREAHSKRIEGREAFTYLELIMASVVFAYSALESFVNEEIPDSYVHVVYEKQKTIHYTKAQIERHLSLDIKLGDVLPSALGVPTPKGGTHWNAYSSLRELRDRIIHMKTEDRQSKGVDESSIWSALVRSPAPRTYTVAKALIDYFYSLKGTRPRWLSKCPF